VNTKVSRHSLWQAHIDPEVERSRLGLVLVVPVIVPVCNHAADVVAMTTSL